MSDSLNMLTKQRNQYLNQSINNSNVSRDRKNGQTQKINESNLLSFENQYIIGSNAGS